MALFLYKPHCVCYLDQGILILTILHLTKKGREVFIKARSPPPSLGFMGKVAERKTVKCPQVFLLDATMIKLRSFFFSVLILL